MKTTNQEVEYGTTVTLSCEISDLDEEVRVQWVKESGDVIVSGGSEYTVSQGNLSSSWIQIATLVINGSSVTEDSLFTCRIHSTQYTNSPSSDTVIKLDIFGES